MTPSGVLVVGAGGFLGRHVRYALRAHGQEDVSFISGSTAMPEETGPDGDRRWHRLDVATADRAGIAAVIRDEQPAAVINCSGVTHGGPDRHVLGNVVLVGELLAAIAATAPGIRFVQIGSSAEYGAVPIGVPIDEKTAPTPVASYGVTKLAATGLTLAAARAGAVDGLVLRVFNPVGRGMSGRSLPGQTAIALRKALESGERQIALGPLGDHRDFVDARDVADAVVAAATGAGRLGPTVLNVGSGRATQARDLVALMASLAGFDGEVDEHASGSPRSSAVPWQQADIGAIETVLGWRPRRPLLDAISDVWSEHV